MNEDTKRSRSDLEYMHLPYATACILPDLSDLEGCSGQFNKCPRRSPLSSIVGMFHHLLIIFSHQR